MKLHARIAAAFFIAATQVSSVFAQDVPFDSVAGSFPQLAAADDLFEDFASSQSQFRRVSWSDDATSFASTSATECPPGREWFCRPSPTSFDCPGYCLPTIARQTRTPDMFGDSFVPLTAQIDGTNLGTFIGLNAMSDPKPEGTYTANLPLGGGARRFKNEQTRAIPTDRAIFVYNHFHNAIGIKQTTATKQTSDDASVDQYTFGFEKTFDDGLWSAEVRMPFTGSANVTVPGISSDNGHIGNGSLILKSLIYQAETTSIAAGLALTAPTGSDTDLRFKFGPASGRLKLENDAYHFLPFLAFLSAPHEDWFIQGLAQLDFAGNSNHMLLTSGNTLAAGSIREQDLMYFDLSVGYWLYRSDEQFGLTGLASVVELHYSGSLNETRERQLGTGANNVLTLGNRLNTFDVLNMTVGVNAEWSRKTSIRTAVVLPLTPESDRFFDSEVQLSLIHRF